MSIVLTYPENDISYQNGYKDWMHSSAVYKKHTCTSKTVDTSEYMMGKDFQSNGLKKNAGVEILIANK